MSSLLLVHGAWMGGWAWERVAADLRARGHEVSCPDLLGYAAADPPAAAVTRAAAVERLGAALDALPAPVVAVGHSMGGTLISELGELRPSRVRHLVYVAAYLLADGQSAAEVSGSRREFWTSALGAEGAIISRPDQGGTAVNPAVAADAFMADASPDDQSWALARLHLDPFAYGATAIHVTGSRWGSAPRSYVETTEDHAVPIAAQRAMHAAAGVGQVISLGSSHMPMLAHAKDLADIIESIAAQAEGARP